MAYYNIEKRLKSDGTPRYRCNVIIKEKGVITYRESKTFPKHAHAKTWGTQKVMELDLYGIPSSNAVDGLTVRDLLHKYLNDPNAGGKAGRTKRYVLELLMDSDISAIKLSELTENDVIEHCRLRNNAGAGPATVSHDVSYLGSVLDAAKPVYGINYTSNPAKSARPYLLKLGLIGKSNRRNRRPASDELDMLIEGLQQRSTHKCSKIPFVDILKFSVVLYANRRSMPVTMGRSRPGTKIYTRKRQERSTQKGRQPHESSLAWGSLGYRPTTAPKIGIHFSI